MNEREIETIEALIELRLALLDFRCAYLWSRQRKLQAKLLERQKPKVVQKPFSLEVVIELARQFNEKHKDLKGI